MIRIVILLVAFTLSGCYVPEELTTYYRDRDGDSYGDENITATAVSRPNGYVTATDIFDCNDRNASIRPYREELKYGKWADIDVNCNGSLEN